jgi:hypothetical protein
MASKGRFRCEILKLFDQAIPAERVADGEDFLRWLVREDEALVAALKREKATGQMRGNWPGVRGRGIYRPRASRFVPAITTGHPDRRNPNPVTHVQG